MSTVMYCFIVPKNQIFDFAKEIRDFQLSQVKRIDDFDKAWEHLRFVKENEEEAGVTAQLQLFDVEKYPDDYVVRVLSNGYGIMNFLWEHPEKYRTCNFDNRTDIPDEDLPNEEVADAIDGLMDQKKYFLVDVVTMFDYRSKILGWK